MKFYTEKDLAICGLACVLCSKENCPGCKGLGCNESNNCSVYQCASKRELDGCYQCSQFPCDEKMLKGTRNKAFNLYAKNYGKQALLDRLRINYENGLSYHNPDGSKGDYDLVLTEIEVIRLIRYGKSANPYSLCPSFETENFIIRLVTEEDAEDLLSCYSDPKAQQLFNTDNCTYGYGCTYNINEMKHCIDLWINAYENQGYIRFAIVAKNTSKTIGTIEMFKHTKGFGLLRLDLLSDYEKEEYIIELTNLCIKEFFLLFNVNELITKIKNTDLAYARKQAMGSLGFLPYESNEYSDYFKKDRIDF